MFYLVMTSSIIKSFAELIKITGWYEKNIFSNYFKEIPRIILASTFS